MVKLSLCSIAVVSICAFPALADDYPIRKAGLWEMSVVGDAGKPMVTRMCLDDVTEAKMIAQGKATLKEICTRVESRREGAAYIVDSVCKPMSSTQTSHQVTTVKSDSEYTLVATSHFDPPFMGKAETTTTQTGKWLGPCEKDMKPGEMIVNGRKIPAPQSSR